MTKSIQQKVADQKRKAHAASVVRDLEADLVSDDRLSAMRLSVTSGECPLCGKSGLRVVAKHVDLEHGLSTKELRDLLGFTFTESILTPAQFQEHSERSAELWKGIAGSGQGKKRRVSKMGAAIHAEVGRNHLSQRPPEIQGAYGRMAKGVKKSKVWSGPKPWLRGRKSPVQHGTHQEWDKGCRCDLCREAQKKYRNALYSRRVLERTGKPKRVYTRKETS